MGRVDESGDRLNQYGPCEYPGELCTLTLIIKGLYEDVPEPQGDDERAGIYGRSRRRLGQEGEVPGRHGRTLCMDL